MLARADGPFNSQWSRRAASTRADSTCTPADHSFVCPLTNAGAAAAVDNAGTAAMTHPQAQRPRRAFRIAALLLLLLLDCAHSAVLLYGRAQEETATTASAASPSPQPVQVRINPDGTASVITPGEAATASGQSIATAASAQRISSCPGCRTDCRVTFVCALRLVQAFPPA